jgi:endonuclease/exonuclease/phosphatase family metal-dependent hydrolase
LKVLSYNIREGGNGRLTAIADIIWRQAPDVVALLEANSRANAKALARGLGMQIVFGKANSKFHIAWLSRLPIQRSANHRLAALAKTLLEVELAWDGAALRLFATHLAGGNDAQHPAQEILAVLDRLRSCAEPHLLVGDLNALHPSDTVGPPPPGEEKMGDAIDGDPRWAIRRVLDAGYVDCYRARHPRPTGYTYPADAPWLRLDYIFASPSMAIRLDACDVVVGRAAAQASDHLPVWAAFR